MAANIPRQLYNLIELRAKDFFDIAYYEVINSGRNIKDRLQIS